MLKVLFFGTPQVAVPFLEWLTSHSEVVGAVCRPDEPAGRGYELRKPPVKALAEQKGIPVYQPSGPWTPETAGALAALKADIGVIVAYGRILPRQVFGAPKLGSVNLHFSLLPLYRGAAPIQWSLIRGETKTGVTAFWLEEGLDSGPIFHQSELAIDPKDTTPTLREKLVASGIGVLERVLADADAGRVLKRAQAGEPTLAPQLKKEDGRIDWSRPAAEIVNLIRGVVEWPGASTTVGAPPKSIKIFRAAAVRGAAQAPGTILAAAPAGIDVQAGNDAVRLEEIQPEGKKPMAAWAFWQGARLSVGDRFGNQSR